MRLKKRSLTVVQNDQLTMGSVTENGSALDVINEASQPEEETKLDPNYARSHSVVIKQTSCEFKESLN